MVRFGINTFLFTGAFTNSSVALFPLFKSWGFDSVEIALDNPSVIDVKLIKKALDDCGLVCGSVCAAMGPGRDLRGSKEEQVEALEYIKSCIEVVAGLGASVLGGPLYSVVGRADFEEEDAYLLQWNTVLNHFKVLGKYAQDFGVKLAVEPINRYETDFINTAEQAMNFISAVGNPSVLIHLDSFHMNIEEKHPDESILKVGDKLGLFHACGIDRGTPGNDHANWSKLLSALKKVNYQGDIVIESFTPEVKVIAKAASIWRKMEPSAEDIAVKGLAFLRSQWSDSSCV